MSILVIAISLTIPASSTSADSGAWLTHQLTGPAKAMRPKFCLDARRAILRYQRLERMWRSRLGAGLEKSRHPARGGIVGKRHPLLACSQAHRRVYLMRERVRKARAAYLRWFHDWAWWKWMPDKWQRIGACETGYGKRPGNFHWNSGAYQGFVGFAASTWDAYRPAGFPSEAYNATPRQQMIVADRVRAAVGYGGWGCGDA